MDETARSSAGLQQAAQAWRRRKWLALSIFAVVFAAAAAAIAGLPAIYSATASVLVDRQQVPEAYVRPAVTGELETRLSTISQEILSRARLEPLARRFGLYPELRRGGGMEAAVEQLRRDIKLEPLGVEQASGRPATIAFRLTYRGRDPQTVADVTNALATSYVAENSTLRERQASRTAKFLKAQLLEMKQKLDDQDRRLGAVPPGAEAELASVERLSMRLRLNSDRQLRLLDRRERLTRDVPAEIPVAGAPASPEAISARLARLNQELAELKTRYSEKYPDVIRTRAEIAALQQRLPEASAAPSAAPRPPVKDGLAELDQEMRALKAEEQTLRQQITLAEQKAELAPRRVQEYQHRARDHATTRELYESLLKRYEDAQIAESLEQGHTGEQFRVLDAAVPPTGPMAPNRSRLMTMALALGLGLAAVGMIAAERMDTTFHTLGALRSFTRVPVLGAIPRSRGRGAAPAGACASGSWRWRSAS